MRIGQLKIPGKHCDESADLRSLAGSCAAMAVFAWPVHTAPHWIPRNQTPQFSVVLKMLTIIYPLKCPSFPKPSKTPLAGAIRDGLPITCFSSLWNGKG